MSVAELRPFDAIEGEAFAALAADAEVEGHRFLARMAAEWQAGTNRFDRPGERVLAAWVGDSLAGLIARGIDPHATDPEVGRLRHLYVRRDRRGSGIGLLLARAALEGAERHFRLIRVRLGAEHAAAAAMYLALGFTRVLGDPFATHTLVLRPPATATGEA